MTREMLKLNQIIYKLYDKGRIVLSTKGDICFFIGIEIYTETALDR